MACDKTRIVRYVRTDDGDLPGQISYPAGHITAIHTEYGLGPHIAASWRASMPETFAPIYGAETSSQKAITSRCRNLDWFESGQPSLPRQHTKNPRERKLAGVRHKKPGGDLLSHGQSHTIIGAKRFHFRVRNGIGWFPLAISARQTVRSEALLRALEKRVSHSAWLGVIWSSLTGN